MKATALTIVVLVLSGCAMTPEQRQNMARAYMQQRMQQQQVQPAQPYIMTTPQQSSTTTNCYSYVANQVQCQSTTTTH